MSGRQARIFAVLGDPVSHSLSPVMHNAAFRALGLDAIYVALPAASDEVESLMRVLIRTGGGGNLTIPHKRLGASLVRSAGGERLVSCNTFWGEDGRLVGTETDSVGLQAIWEELGSPEGDWLIVGTGGGALGAARAAARLGRSVRVRSRSPRRAVAFEGELRALGTPLADPESPIGVVVNCTPLGLGPGDPLPLPPGEIPMDAVAIDLVYARGGTRWIRALREHGIRAVDGRSMLVSQGAASLEHWFPGLKAPLEIMRAAVGDALD